jgi:hypothetical protein
VYRTPPVLMAMWSDLIARKLQHWEIRQDTPLHRYHGFERRSQALHALVLASAGRCGLTSMGYTMAPKCGLNKTRDHRDRRFLRQRWHPAPLIRPSW